MQGHNAMQGHIARSKSKTTIQGHNAKPQCKATMQGHNSKPHSVAMRFSTVIATLLVFTIYFTSNSNAVGEHKNGLHLELHHLLLVQNS